MDGSDAEVLKGCRFGDEMGRCNAGLLLQWLREQACEAEPLKRPGVILSGPAGCGKSHLLRELAKAAGVKWDDGEVHVHLNVNDAMLDDVARRQVKMLVVEENGKMRKKEVEGAVKWIAMPLRWPEGGKPLPTRAQFVMITNGDVDDVPAELERRCIQVRMLARE
jgi:hypothetical protein